MAPTSAASLLDARLPREWLRGLAVVPVGGGTADAAASEEGSAASAAVHDVLDDVQVMLLQRTTGGVAAVGVGASGAEGGGAFAAGLARLLAAEKALVSALGHHEEEVRDRAVVLLNVLYDGHPLQLGGEPLPVSVLAAGEPAEIAVPFVSAAGAGGAKRAAEAAAGFDADSVVLKLFIADGALAPTPADKDIDNEGAAADEHGISSSSSSSLHRRAAAATDGELGLPPVSERKRSNDGEPSLSDAPPGCRALVGASRGRWRAYRVAVKDGCLVVSLGAFQGVGFFDWYVAPASHSAQDTTHPVQYAGVRGIDFRRLRGRFLVQPRNTRAHRLCELPADQVGAQWDVQTGALLSRGSFEHVRRMVPELASAGITGMYVSGCLERPLDEDEPSPHTVVDRAAPATVLGGPSAFRRMCEAAERAHIATIIDCVDRVSLAHAHRRYGRTGYVRLVDSKRHVPALPHPGTDCKEVQWEDTALPNYRRVETWYSLLLDVMRMSSQYGVRGVRLDNAQSVPCMLAPNREELSRVDNDGEPHYSPEERAFGDVVLPNVEGGYWSTDAALDGYANPLLLKLVREMWAVHPEFLLLGESHFRREQSLVVSGVIPHTMRVPKILAGISGKSLRRDGSVRSLGRGRWLTANVLARLYKSDRNSIPRGSIMVGCTCSDVSPYPSVLYGRRAWLAVDLLFFLPDLPMTLLGEEEGRAMRINMASVSREVDMDANLDLEVPKSPRMTRPPSLSGGLSNLSLSSTATTTPTTTAVAASNALNAASGVGSAATLTDSKKLKRSGSREAGLGRLSDLTKPSQSKPPTPSASMSASAKAMVRSRSSEDMRQLSVRSVSAEDLRQLTVAEETTRDEIGPLQGYDIRQIHGHYDHRRKLRNEYEALREGGMVALSVKGLAKMQVLAFARYTHNQVLLAFANVRGDVDGPQFSGDIAASVDLRPLAAALSIAGARSTGRSASYFSRWDALVRIKNCITGDERQELYALEELLFRKLDVTLRPLETKLLELVRADGDAGDAGYEHLHAAVTRLMEEDETIMDPRENWLSGRLVRACGSFAEFARGLEQLRSDLLDTVGVTEANARYLARLCLQRATMLDGQNEYAPDEFVPPSGERLLAFLMHLSVASGDVKLRDAARGALAGNVMGPIVLFTPEIGRFSTAGGLGTMIDELSKGLADLGLEVYVVSPYYHYNRRGERGYLPRDGIKWTRNVDVRVGDVCTATLGLFEGRENGVNLVFFEHHGYFPRVYQDLGTQARIMEMLVAANRGLLEICCHKQLRPSLIVTNDWVGGLAAAYGRLTSFGGYFDDCTFFHIVHNLGDSAYEGRVYPSPAEGAFEYIHHLPRDLLVDPMWDRAVCNPSRCAFRCSHYWGTVSKSYLEELLSSHPLHYVMRDCRAPFGMSNGIRVRDRLALLRRVAPSHEEAKAALQARYFNGNVDPTVPVFTFVGRLTSQKGVHMILHAVEHLVRFSAGRIQVLVGGMANHADPYGAACARQCYDLRARFPRLFSAEPDDFFSDGPLVNLGSDFCLMPSAFEPGGIVQHEFFVGGTPVVAFRTGGLRDSVVEWDGVELTGNGFVFNDYTQDEFVAACKRALRVFGKSDEYMLLRQSAFESTMDVATVSFAWAQEFHRVKNIVPSSAARLRDEVAAVRDELAALAAADARRREAPAVPVQQTAEVAVAWRDRPAESVRVMASWDGWSREWYLSPCSEREWRLDMRLPRGAYSLKFCVDGEWVVSEALPTVAESGAVNNLLQVT